MPVYHKTNTVASQLASNGVLGMTWCTAQTMALYGTETLRVLHLQQR